MLLIPDAGSLNSAKETVNKLVKKLQITHSASNKTTKDAALLVSIDLFYNSDRNTWPAKTFILTEDSYSSDFDHVCLKTTVCVWIVRLYFVWHGSIMIFIGKKNQHRGWHSKMIGFLTDMTFYYIVDSKILKIHRKIFSISSLVKISITWSFPANNFVFSKWRCL